VVLVVWVVVLQLPRTMVHANTKIITKVNKSNFFILIPPFLFRPFLISQNSFVYMVTDLEIKGFKLTAPALWIYYLCPKANPNGTMGNLDTLHLHTLFPQREIFMNRLKLLPNFLTLDIASSHKTLWPGLEV
jgi:hypothetical protein